MLHSARAPHSIGIFNSIEAWGGEFMKDIRKYLITNHQNLHSPTYTYQANYSRLIFELILTLLAPGGGRVESTQRFLKLKKTSP